MPDATAIQPSPAVDVTPLPGLRWNQPSVHDLGIATLGLDLPPSVCARFQRVRVFPDAHGTIGPFERAVRAADRDNCFVLQLGDTIDRGEHSPRVVELMLELEQDGRGLMLMGNHELKFACFVLFGTYTTASRPETERQFEAWPDATLLARFVARIEEGPAWITTGSWFFVHAAFDPRMLEPVEGEIEHGLLGTALFGLGRGRAARQPVAIQAWVDRIPQWLTVVVGHVVTPSHWIEYRQGRAGGRAILLDTGAWRDPDGTLASLDIPL